MQMSQDYNLCNLHVKKVGLKRNYVLKDIIENLLIHIATILLRQIGFERIMAMNLARPCHILLCPLPQVEGAISIW